MAHAAAAVSVLKEKGGINSALKDVCRASGLDKKKLKVFRENILRGVESPKAEYFYKWTVAEFMTKAPGDRREVALGLLADFSPLASAGRAK